MSPVDQAVAKVLANMSAAARAGKLAMFSKPVGGMDEPVDPDIAPPDAMSGEAGLAADTALDGAAPGDDAEEADPNDPSDDELEQLMSSMKK